MRAIIFDFDGTIVDTEWPCYQSWIEVYEAHGCTLPPELWINVVGTAHGAFDPWSFLEEQVGRRVDRESWEVRRRARELELGARQHVRPGVLELVEAAEAAGLRIGVATSSHWDWVERHLRRLNLLDRFDTVVSADDVERVKPDPALYTLAAARLGVDVSEGIAIEDSPTGALGAKRARLACVVVPNDVTREYEFPKVDAIWPTLEGVTLDDVVEVWRRSRHQE